MCTLQAQKKRQASGKPPRVPVPRVQADSADSEESTGTDFDTTDSKANLSVLQPGIASAGTDFCAPDSKSALRTGHSGKLSTDRQKATQ